MFQNVPKIAQSSQIEIISFQVSMKKMIQATLRLKPQVHRRSNIRNICQMMYLEITMITIIMTIIQVKTESSGIFQLTIVSRLMEFQKKSRLAGKY